MWSLFWILKSQLLAIFYFLSQYLLTDWLIDWLVEILDFCIIFNEKKYNFCSYRASIRNTFAMSGVINERITTRKFLNQHEIDGKDMNYRKWSFSNIYRVHNLNKQWNMFIFKLIIWTIIDLFKLFINILCDNIILNKNAQ
jgi:hypothetical protein